MKLYRFPEHIPYDPQPDWITDTLHEDIDMTENTEKLFNELIERLSGVLDCVDKLKETLNTEVPSQGQESAEDINVLRTMLEAETERANTAETKLKAVLGALNG